VITFNLLALVLATTGVWTYPRRYTGAMVLGNLYVAILTRNELFGRCLYLLINTLFAKVRKGRPFASFGSVSALYTC
jgi:hypothetical protein